MAKAAQQDWGFSEITRKFERETGRTQRPAPPRKYVSAGGAAHAGVWLTAVAVCLLGLVALHVGILKKNLEFNSLISEKSELAAEKARLSSEVATLRSPARVEQIAIHDLGMVPADKVQYVYISPAGTQQTYADLDPLGVGTGRAAP